MVCLGAPPCGSTHTPLVGLKIRKVPPSLNLILSSGDTSSGRSTNTLPPVLKPSGSPAVKPHPAGDRPATGASRSCVALARSASAPPYIGNALLGDQVHTHCATFLDEGSRDPAPVAGVSGKLTSR